ncbi:MAG: c-type cytochrome, partial [Solirubrobacteraceae bacterium]
MSRLRTTSTAAMATLTLATLLALPAGPFTSPAGAQPPSGIVRPDPEPRHASLELGSELFAANCASCHGIAGTGITRARPGAGDLSGMGPPLRHVGARAADFYLRTGLM